MLALMWDSEDRGFLITDGTPWTVELTARAIGEPTETGISAVQRLRERGIVRVDKRGAMYSPRLLEISARRAAEAKKKRKQRVDVPVRVPVHVPDLVPPDVPGHVPRLSRGESEFRVQSQNNNDDERNRETPGKTPDVVVVEILVRAGFDEPDARRMAATAGERQARNAVAEADRLAREGKLRVSKRAWIATALHRNFALPDHTGKAEQTGVRAAKKRVRDIEHLRARMEKITKPEDLRTLMEVFGGWDGVVDAGVLTPNWQDTSDRLTRDRLLRIASEMAVGGGA